jgi:hypothetical protein
MATRLAGMRESCIIGRHLLPTAPVTWSET